MIRLLSAKIAAIIILSFGAVALAGEKPYKQTEEKIIAEMEALIDKTGQISDEDNAACIKLIKQGIQEHDKGEYRKAVEFYEKALKKNPLSSTAFYEMGYSYHKMGSGNHADGDLQKALDAATRSIILNPKSESALTMKAGILDDLGLSDDAVEAYRKIIELKPDSFLAHLNLGITLIRKKDIDKARLELMRAHELEPEHPSPFLNLAICANMKGETYEEEKYLKEFARVGKNDKRLPMIQQRLKELKSANVTLQAPDKSNAAAKAGYQGPVKDKVETSGSEKQLSIGIGDLPGLVLITAEKSKLTYQIGASTPEEGARFRKQEGNRFQDAFRKSGLQCVTNKEAQDALKAMAGNATSDALIKVVRTFMPGDEEWNTAIPMFSRLVSRYRDLAPPPSAAGFIEKQGDKVQVKADPTWLLYYFAKALWRYEPGFRQRFGGSNDDNPSIAEEEFALAALVGGNKNKRESKENKSAVDPYFDTIESTFSTRTQTGFILFEIIHKTYGVALECLPSDQAEELRNYLLSMPLERIKAGEK
jgi:tetratricopeptide (TPR) repeat protein